MGFKPNKTPAEIIKESSFGGNYFRDIYYGVNGKFYKNSWQEFKELGGIDKKYYASHFYDVGLNKYGVKCGTSLKFWKSKGWINKNDPYRWLQWYLRDLKMIKGRLADGKDFLVDLKVF